MAVLININIHRIISISKFMPYSFKLTPNQAVLLNEFEDISLFLHNWGGKKLSNLITTISIIIL